VWAGVVLDVERRERAEAGPERTDVEGIVILDKVKPRFPKELFDWYEENGFEHFLKLTGKYPANKGRRRTLSSLGTIQVYTSGGFNVGVLIPQSCLVLDVDQRNGGAESLVRLLADAFGPGSYGVSDLVDSTFSVRTGGGGLHLYFKHDPGRRPRNNLQGYPGVDLQTHPKASYVVAPYSVHPDTGRAYEPLPDPLGAFRPLARLPEPLEALILMPSSDVVKLTAERAEDARHPLWGLIESDELAALLEALNPVDFCQYDDWISLLSAAHHATGGSVEASQVFAEWSARDPDFIDKAHKAVDKQWGTFHERRSGGNPLATVDTILAHVRQAERSYSELLGEPLGGASPALAAVQAVERKKVAAELEVMAEEAESSAELRAGIESLPGNWKDDGTALHKLITRISQQPELHWDELCGALSERAGGKPSTAQIRKHVRRERAEREKAAKPERQTYARIVADATVAALKEIEGGPDDLACAPKQPFLYEDGVWRKISKERIASVCQVVLQRALDVDAKGTLPLNRYAADATASILNVRATQSTDLYYREDLPNCINLLNGTLWFESDGTYKLKPHRRENYLTTQIPYAYKSRAKCPSFDTMLEQVFAHYAERYSTAERDDFIRHLWEVAGYILQPNKDHPVALFWIGSGQNGKSKIAEILTKLIGKDALLSCDAKQLLGENNNHATAALEGKLLFLDDDVSISARIDDGVLKKVSQKKDLTINPKGKDSRGIVVHTAALFIANTEPRFKDASKGFDRRTFATYFDTNIKHLQDSPLPAKAIAEEMPGILNKAAQGLARLRKRGDFDLPRSAMDDRKRFLRRAVPLIGFWAAIDKVPDPDAVLSTDILYTRYRQSMLDDGHKRVADKLSFISALKNQDVDIDEKRIKGWKFAGIV